MEEKLDFFHGTLEVTIFHATPYTPFSPLNCLLAKGKPACVTIKIDGKKLAQTSHDRDRVWNHTFHVLCAHPSTSIIVLSLKTTFSVLGRISIPANRMLKESRLIDGLFPLLSEGGKPNSELKLRFMLWFRPAEHDVSWKKILGNGDFKGLQNATFPQRSNCQVVLYQDAHHLSTFQPPFRQSGAPRRLWEDVYKAIDNAKILIYVAGWSFNPNTVLVRDSDHTNIPYAVGVKLGDLLKLKAEEGVVVKIMIWDDETSLPFIKNEGIMRTHEQDALTYFKNTKVVCRLCPKLHPLSLPLFSHHQKTIILDTQSHIQPSRREIMSFLGGLDLCDGRFDTEQHSLFHTLKKQSHNLDFYQTSIAGAKISHGGPREPWHDAHACVTGEAACDILTNFEQRWAKQCDASSLVPTATLMNLTLKPEISRNNSPQRNWKAQVFRSIDHLSVTQLSKTSTVEKSIHDAYVEAIRRAERFIYIENQYFIGGCHMWERDLHCGCSNLIPVEIALKVVSKIKARERFSVYIVIPMWPEGVPESETVQDILHWSRETMAMMYRLIGEAMREYGDTGAGHPRDYLNFFCLANREGRANEEFVPPYSPQLATQYFNAQINRRFMIYVHSKLMIVDDLYIIIGSANVNQRSMDGQRDTEIAIGCYQTENGGDTESLGEIFSYRLSLWYEHTGGLAEELFQEPHSLECVQKMRNIGDQMWKIYSGDEIIDMKGVHLVTYPVIVKQDGSLEDQADCGGLFPDTKCQVKGKRSTLMPTIFTT